MKKLMLFVCALFLSASAFAQTADEILAKHFKAIGMDKMKAVKSLKASGKMKMGAMELPIVITKARPEQMRVDFTVQGMTGTQAYDGTTGWMVMPFMGKKDPEKMSEDMLAGMKEEADFDGPLVDYKAKGNALEFVQKEDVQGTPAYKLKLTTKSGSVHDIYIDADTNLIIKQTGKRKMQGQEIESETLLGDYKEVDGMMFPYSFDSHPVGQAVGQSVTIEKYEINPAVDKTAFAMPDVKKEEPKVEAKKEQ